MKHADNNRAEAAVELIGSIIPMEWIIRGAGNEPYVHVTPGEFDLLVPHLAAQKYTLISLFGAEGFHDHPGLSLFYVFEKQGALLILLFPVTGRAVSIARVFPSASWFERECHDGFGVEFEGAFDTRRLLFHETYPDDFHPLKKSFKNTPVATKPVVRPEEEYPFRKVTGEGVYQVPVGPVHAGIIEPGHFRFSVIGETIFNLEIRMFYKHRGIEKLAEGKNPESCLKIAEAVSGDESAANTIAFCTAVEKISGIGVPDRAWYLRTILLEMERISSHLGDEAGMLVDVAFPIGASQFAVLREEILQENERLTGSRFLRGIIRIGGLDRDISTAQLSNLSGFLDRIRKQFRIGLKIVLSTQSVIDRFATTGIIRQSYVLPLNLTGPVGRASGSTADVRITNPYGIYDRYAPSPKTLRDGDVLARFTVKAAEILDSLDLIGRLIKEMPDGEIRSSGQIQDGFCLALVESPRGQNLCWLSIRNGHIDRYKVRTASFCNWLAIEHAVQGDIIADFPVINKSLNLSYAGTDL
jgi:Ni,Fe-hydrogenase III large subunit/Ni,Fe-hydrogenase III component G